MVLVSRKAVELVAVVVGALVVVAGMGVPAANANPGCDLMLSADVDGAVTEGALGVSVLLDVDSKGLTYFVDVPTGFTLEWLDGAFAVDVTDTRYTLGGGVLVREPVLSGEFTQLTACFSRTSAPVAPWGDRANAVRPGPQPLAA
ncbi:MAG: hypothetical protein ABFR95_00325 [Actinomycetota bacterium]